MTPTKSSPEDFSKTIMGYQGDFGTSKKFWNYTEDVEYYRNLYSRTEKYPNGTEYIESWDVHASRGPRNYAGEAAIFYFLMDPDRVRFPVLKTPLSDWELNHDRCNHLKLFPKQYHILECCQTQPSDGSPTTQEKINQHSYSYWFQRI